ncbi:MAG: PhzF family phenazine biosynthesis protein [Pseudomonadota bacterium]
MQLDFQTLDVFTEDRFGGNPLAVVFGGDALDTEAMQTIAREFNLSETVFVLNAEQEVHRARLRIFTPKSELPFAGHPTVGTACALATQDAAEMADAPRDQMLVLELGVGPVRCAVTLDEGRAPFAIFDLAKLPQEHANVPSIEAIARAHGLQPDDIGFEDHVPSGFNAGIPKTLVPVRDLATIQRARLDLSAWLAAFNSKVTGSTFLYTRECERHDAAFHARMFAPDAGILEDPATGSAVAAFAGAIMKFDTPTLGTHEYLIEQGYEMGRPSLIQLSLEVEHATLTSARIGGYAVPVSKGTLNI